jgi:hypothetical protein
VRAPETDASDAWLAEIAGAYVEALGQTWSSMLGFALACVGGLVIGQLVVGRWRAGRVEGRAWAGARWLRLAVVVVLIGLGVAMAIRRAACYDDAYISFRYAENLIAGEGLVYNSGERVEGYTNFLWTILLAGLHALLPIETPMIAIVACLLAFAANLFVVWRITLEVAPPEHAKAFAFPLAVALLAVQNTFVDYGTSGLETGFASLLVDLGVWALVRTPTTRTMFAAGLCWILATLTRPDHAIFYAVGSAVVVGIWIGPIVRTLRERAGLRATWTAGLAPMVAYAAPFVLWLIHAAWKLDYYGSLLPNTYYAKSADLPYWSQGLIYAADFHLSSHLWIALLTLAIVLPFARPSQGPGRRLLAYVLPVVIAYELYVMRIGGDFMEGRFYVSLIPLILLVGELAIHELSRQMRSRWPAIVVASLLAATACGVRLVPPRGSAWHLTDESSYYPITEWSPITIGHSNYQTGVILGRLHARGIDPVIASGAIGLLGYYSGMTMIDRLGLTDATVAHQRIRERGRPGHEKWATTAYLERRGVHFVRGGPYPPWFTRQGTIHWGQRGGRTWWILRYDPELMQAIREADPKVRFEDFPRWLDRHLAKLPRLPKAEVRREFAFFRRYYFDHQDDHQDDPIRRAAYERALESDSNE